MMVTKGLAAGYVEKLSWSGVMSTTRLASMWWRDRRRDWPRCGGETVCQWDREENALKREYANCIFSPMSKLHASYALPIGDFFLMM
jgi:hypothetical protein